MNLNRARMLRRSACFIPPDSFLSRKEHFCAKEGGVLRKKGATAAVNPMMDPGGMQSMMMGQMMMIIPNIVLYSWVTYMFSGFVLIKLPFPLTLRFKDMFQKVK
jgi:hypothetical protein